MSYAEYEPVDDCAPMNVVAARFEQRSHTLLIDRPAPWGGLQRWVLPHGGFSGPKCRPPSAVHQSEF